MNDNMNNITENDNDIQNGEKNKEDSSLKKSENNINTDFIESKDKKAEKQSFLNKYFQRALKKLPSLSAKGYRIVVVLFALLALALSVIRVVVIRNSVEFPGFSGTDLWYKLRSTTYTKVFFGLYVGVVIVAYLISIFSHKVEFGKNKRSNAFVFVSSLAGFCMVGCAGFFVYRIALFDDTPNKLFYWVILTMLFTGAYFAMDAVGFVSQKSRPWFTFGGIAFGVLRLLYDFVRLHEFQYLSSNEYHLVSLVTLLLFFCNNSRFHVYENAGVLYKFTGLFASVSLLVYSIPELYISLFEPHYVDSVFVFCLVDAVLAFYIFAKLLSIKVEKNEKISMV